MMKKSAELILEDLKNLRDVLKRQAKNINTLFALVVLMVSMQNQ